MSAKSSEAENGSKIAINNTNNEKKPTVIQKQASVKKVNDNIEDGDGGGIDHRSARCTTTCSFKLPRPTKGTLDLPPLRFLKNLGEKMATAIRTRIICARKTCPSSNSKVMSSSSGSEFRAKTSVAPIIDSQRAEAIDDCIQFINSSSSLPRSNSVSVVSN